MRSRSWLLAAAVAIAVQMSPMLETVSAQSSPGIVLISEFRFRGPSPVPAGDAGAVDEFIELYNPGPAEVSLAGWTLWASNISGGASVRATFPATAKIAPRCHFLIANAGFSGTMPRDLSYATGFADNGGVAILNGSAIIDQVGLGTGNVFGEGTHLVRLPNVNSSYERKPGGTLGNGQDTHNNADDFRVISPATPQNSATANCVTETVLLTHDVQGSGRVSEMVDRVVTVRGVVTSRTNNGFFLQTADGDEDDDRLTSEGLFVAHVSPAAQVGRVLHVTGTVAEFNPDDPRSGPVTHLRRVTSVSDVGSSAVPAAHELTRLELDPNGSLQQLERFEGMRVTASLRSVSGTSLDGSFYAVLHDVARPFREPGIEVGSPALSCASEPCAFVSFDGNPERLRVDSDGVEGVAAVNLSSGAVMNVAADGVMTGVTGPLDFAMGAYTLLPEATLQPSGGTTMTAAPAATARQFSIASLNLGDPAAMPHATRVAKASLMVRAMLNLPDIIAVQEASTAVLGELATRIDDDAVAANLAAPGYAALDGFLVRTSRVTASAEFVGGNATFTDPGNGTTVAAFDRLPVMLRAVVNGGPLMLPQQVTVLNNQFRSLDGAGRNDVEGQRVRAQRQAQAEWHGNFVQDRQLNDPAEALVSLGNFNTHAFNDGYVDVMGTALGSPAAAEQVVLASPDLVSPNLMYFGGGYSLVAEGNTQSLDHMVATANLGPQFESFAFARVNADFPEALRALADNPGRLSDRDPSVAYFSFPPDVDAPVFRPVSNPDDVEATGPDGAAVEFPTPTATDNLDLVVLVTCTRDSGTTFPLGNTGVTCSAQDAAGNSASVSFTVTVEDTTPPSLTVPENIVGEAVSPGGRVVTFSTSATDTVSGAVAVLCQPASGSVFPLGTTSVLCRAEDAAGNDATESFTVTVEDTIGPVVTVPPDINEEASSAEGRAITFAASAIDAVSGSVGVSCVPASGSTFPIGTTAVDCTASDAAGNLGSAHFSVTVSRPIPGRMHGGGTVHSDSKRVAFTFDAGESDNFVERGWLSSLARDGNGRPRPFLGMVHDVTFSDAEGYEPGGSVPNGVDTVTFSGVGWWNGLPNHRFVVTASDRGEPGVGYDTFSLVVTSPAGVVVESISGVLRGGNIQSLRH